MRKALEGIKVIQLANFIAAAATGRYLADHGADVIIVEAAKGDPIRFTQEQEGRPQNIKENVAWEYLNGNKRCISINTKTEEGKEALFALLEDADVLLTNWRLGALERAGLDYESIKERFPKLIYAMILGYGKTGPDKDLPGFDFTAFFGRGGYTQNLRRRGNDPITMIPGLGDNNVGLMLAMGIITALFNREKTGKGDFVTTSLYETAIFNMSMMLLGVQYDGQAHDYPISIYDNYNPLNGAYRTSDDRIIQCACPNYDVLDTATNPLPFYGTLSALGFSGLKLVYVITVFVAVLSTAVGFRVGAVASYSNLYRKADESAPLKDGLLVVVLLLACAAASKIGIVKLVSTGYTILGYLNLPLLIFPAIVLANRKIRKGYLEENHVEASGIDD